MHLHTYLNELRSPSHDEDDDDTCRTEVNSARMSGRKLSWCVQTLRAETTQGLWAIGATHLEARKTAERSLAQVHFWREESNLPAGKKRNVKIGMSMLTCPDSIGSVSHRMLRSKKNRALRAVHTYLASLNSLAHQKKTLYSKHI